MACSLLVKSYLPLQSLEVGDELVGDPHFIISVMWIPLIPKLPLSKHQKLAPPRLDTKKKRRGEAKKIHHRGGVVFPYGSEYSYPQAS